jgi:hypothetical protein
MLVIMISVANKFGMTQLVIIWVLLVLWNHCVIPLMGFNNRLW